MNMLDLAEFPKREIEFAPSSIIGQAFTKEYVGNRAESFEEFTGHKLLCDSSKKRSHFA